MTKTKVVLFDLDADGKPVTSDASLQHSTVTYDEVFSAAITAVLRHKKALSRFNIPSREQRKSLISRPGEDTASWDEILSYPDGITRSSEVPNKQAKQASKPSHAPVPAPALKASRVSPASTSHGGSNREDGTGNTAHRSMLHRSVSRALKPTMSIACQQQGRNSAPQQQLTSGTVAGLSRSPSRSQLVCSMSIASNLGHRRKSSNGGHVTDAESGDDSKPAGRVSTSQGWLKSVTGDGKADVALRMLWLVHDELEVTRRPCSAPTTSFNLNLRSCHTSGYNSPERPASEDGSIEGAEGQAPSMSRATSMLQAPRPATAPNSLSRRPSRSALHVQLCEEGNPAAGLRPSATVRYRQPGGAQLGAEQGLAGLQPALARHMSQKHEAWLPGVSQAKAAGEYEEGYVSEWGRPSSPRAPIQLLTPPLDSFVLKAEASCGNPAGASCSNAGAAKATTSSPFAAAARASSPRAAPRSPLARSPRRPVLVTAAQLAGNGLEAATRNCSSAGQLLVPGLYTASLSGVQTPKKPSANQFAAINQAMAGRAQRKVMMGGLI